MATWRMVGLNDYIKRLEELENDTDEIMKTCIYKAVNIVMKEVRNSIDNIPADDRREVKGELMNGLRTIQKVGLQHSVGVSPMEDDKGYWNVKIGFDGRNRFITKRNPDGELNVRVARMIESGSSYMKKYPFMRKAETKSREEAEKVMEQVFIEEIKKREV